MATGALEQGVFTLSVIFFHIRQRCKMVRKKKLIKEQKKSNETEFIVRDKNDKKDRLIFTH